MHGRSRTALAGAAAVALLAGTALAVSGHRMQKDHQRLARAEAMTGGHAAAGLTAISRYSCGACHEIPGVPGADGKVGPPLTGVAGRVIIAGRLPNTPQNLRA